MKYKIGDRLICKKELELFSGKIIPIGIDYFIKQQISKNLILSKPNGDTVLTLPIEIISEHFYTEKEFRKQKLEKLNEI